MLTIFFNSDRTVEVYHTGDQVERFEDWDQLPPSYRRNLVFDHSKWIDDGKDDHEPGVDYLCFIQKGPSKEWYGPGNDVF